MTYRKRGRMSDQMTEKLYDESGKLLLEQPYPFRRLFAVGQEQVINSTRMTVLSCEKNGNTVTTRVRLGGEQNDRHPAYY
jgi:hypothetical protein